MVGTKADLVDDKERIKELNRGGNIGEYSRHFTSKIFKNSLMSHEIESRDLKCQFMR